MSFGGPRLYAVTFSVHIPAEEYLRYYRGSARDVLVTADDGRTVRFPASLLRGVVTHEGIKGRFRLVYDEHGKSHGLDRLA